ncbi:MAG: hypothetical protein GWM90_07365 [Gemmatimonadetes bacterium]|nr:hypothetical protein [Gemmatimonadota bacterium]NIQ53668.1 hypothetical protein [Gemmatimonadota bacterium]NIU73832.1 hypothetical protein [Gammaproteobacteria bacterium]NIX43933.1 hypothetical protein [Gemmatimonadota bacterium]NIY08149.1 hypothetical protein [Gemmatimonadota bacterium]
MRLSVKGFALAGAVVWGVGVFLAGLLAILEPDWGARYMELLGAIYPGVEGTSFGAVIIATLYAVVDAGIGCAVFAWLYNRFAGPAST